MPKLRSLVFAVHVHVSTESVCTRIHSKSVFIQVADPTVKTAVLC